MKWLLKLSIFFVSFLIVAGVQAADVKVGDIMIVDAYIRAMPASAKVTSGYLEIHNHGHESDQLLAVQSSSAARIEIHEMRMEGDVMRMRPLPEGLELPAGETIALRPGGYHLMIFDPMISLVKGENFPMELHFGKAGTVSINFAIRDLDDKRDDDNHHTHHHHTH